MLLELLLKVLQVLKEEVEEEEEVVVEVVAAVEHCPGPDWCLEIS